GGHFYGAGERNSEPLKTAIVLASLGKLIKLAFGILNLLPRREVDWRFEGDVDHLLADNNKHSAGGQIVDGATVVLGVDDGGCFGREPGEILTYCKSRDVNICRQECLERHRIRDFADPNHAAGDLINFLVYMLEEMARL